MVKFIVWNTKSAWYEFVSLPLPKHTKNASNLSKLWFKTFNNKKVIVYCILIISFKWKKMTLNITHCLANFVSMLITHNVQPIKNRSYLLHFYRILVSAVIFFTLLFCLILQVSGSSLIIRPSTTTFALSDRNFSENRTRLFICLFHMRFGHYNKSLILIINAPVEILLEVSSVCWFIFRQYHHPVILEGLCNWIEGLWKTESRNSLDGNWQIVNDNIMKSSSSGH